MIWKNIRKKRIWELKKAELKEGNQKCKNPARGWYAIYTFHIENEISKDELKWSLRDGESVALVRVDLSKYRDQQLDQTAIHNLAEILSFFKEYQRDVIFRPTYDIDGNGREKEPDDFQMVLRHLEQIGEILTMNEHSVFLFQGMLIGSWGEMHDSKYLSKQCLQQMCGTLKKYLDQEGIYLAIRTPAQWRSLISEEGFTMQRYQNLCIFDDALFGSNSHLGTFGTMTREAAGWENSWNAKEELSFLDQLNKELPCVGEAIYPTDHKELSQTEVLWQMKKMHLSCLNAVYDQKLLDFWKSQEATDSKWDNFYDEIGEHLGYRFLVTEFEILKRKRNELWMCGEIKNIGFGSLPQEAELLLVIQDEKEEKEILINIDLCKIEGGGKKNFEVRLKLQEGKLFLKMHRKKDQRAIFFANENATDQLYLGDLWQEI